MKETRQNWTTIYSVFLYEEIEDAQPTVHEISDSEEEDGVSEDAHGQEA
jgi:hypothetical protein